MNSLVSETISQHLTFTSIKKILTIDTGFSTELFRSAVSHLVSIYPMLSGSSRQELIWMLETCFNKDIDAFHTFMRSISISKKKTRQTKFLDIKRQTRQCVFIGETPSVTINYYNNASFWISFHDGRRDCDIEVIKWNLPTERHDVHDIVCRWLAQIPCHCDYRLFICNDHVAFMHDMATRRPIEIQVNYLHDILKRTPRMMS